MTLRSIPLLAASALASTLLSGCLVAGYSSSGGWFLWPGGLGLILMILLALFFFRGRR